MPALTIVNDVLLAGMRTVGELFGSGQMQLPFVLQSAETMKAAAECLSLPVHPSLSQGDLERIVEAVNTLAKAGA